MMVSRRLLPGVAVVVVLVLGASVSASAGGAVWRFDRDQYKPGDVATAVTGIAWEHNPSLGTPEDGPYFAYLVSPDSADGVADAGVPWPGIPAGAIPVGQVETADGPVEEAPGFLVGPHHARLRFTVPSVPAGSYHVRVCNRPCTKTLADIIGGQVVVDAGSPVASAPVAEPSATATNTTSSSSGARDISVPLTLGVAAALGIAASWWFTRQRRLTRVPSRATN
jgi:hypothetical protein